MELLLPWTNVHQVGCRRFLSYLLSTPLCIRGRVRHFLFLVGLLLRIQIPEIGVSIYKFFHDVEVCLLGIWGLDDLYRILMGLLIGSVKIFGGKRPFLRILFQWSSNFVQPCLVFYLRRHWDDLWHHLLAVLGLHWLLGLRYLYVHGISLTNMGILG